MLKYAFLLKCDTVPLCSIYELSHVHAFFRYRPNATDFGNHLSWFLQDIPSVQCPKGGRAAYEDAVRYTSSEDSSDITATVTSCLVENVTRVT